MSSSIGSLGGAEARAALALAADLAVCGSPNDLEAALVGLPSLVGAEYVGAGEVRRRAGDGEVGVLPQVTQPYVFEAEALADWAAHMHQHPVFARQLVSPIPEALSYSDFVSGREWRKLGIYSAYRRLGLRGELSLHLAWDERRTACLTVHRIDRPFGGRERELLDTLAPHLRAAYARLELNRDSERWRAALERGLEHAGACVVMVDAAGAIVEVNAGAAEMLRRWFGSAPTGGALPGELEEWFEASRAAVRAPRFVRERAGWRLEVVLVGGVGEASGERLLVLRERRAGPADPAELAEALPVTQRQAEVLALLGEGRSDAEIAHLLGISVRTVGHHVEHILQRLGVSNRTAAARVVGRIPH
ncbi:MAG: response regulator transcription factor [Actinobacteria bacterium]|nr:response regulator transcription factor [Actinomycetota bacterium]